MTAYGTDLVPKSTINDLCAARARAAALYEETVETLKRAQDAHRDACQIGGHAHLPYIALDSNDRWGDADKFAAKMLKQMDRDIWRGIVIGTPIASLMDAQERDEFQKSLDKDPPPATADNVRATLERLIGESDQIFRRGLVNAFKKLDRDYASNDGFKIGERIVLTWGVTWDKTMGWFTLGERRAQEFRDIDRVMHVLDSKEAPSHMQGLNAAVSEMCYRGNGKTITETPYWRVRIFKNGNIHLWPLRRDLLDRTNRIIAEHYGLVVPAPKGSAQGDPAYQPAPGQAFKTDFFATPADLANRIVAEADIKPGMLVLEPSAGIGDLAEPVYQIVGGAHVTCYEIDRERADQCAAWQFDVRCRDFLSEPPEPIYDRVVMNPPFSAQQDVRHVLHALKFLKPGGRLVAIMGAGVISSSHKLPVALRALVERQGGTFERLPDGSFKASGTSVRTVLLTVDVPSP